MRSNSLPAISTISANSTAAERANTYANALSGWFWQSLTWSLFGLGYFFKSAIALPPAALAFGWYTALLKNNACLLIIATAWFINTLDSALTKANDDFDAFIDLGPGGTPSTWNGFKRVTLLAWFGRINVLKPPKHQLGSGFITALPAREGQRPQVGGIAPQRQLNQRNSKQIFAHLLESLDDFAAANTSHLRKDKSFLEKMTTAIFAHCDCVSTPGFRTFGCEITHPHHVDGSLHVIIHPEDIRTVIEAGWGERHPLARADSWWTAWFSTFEKRPPVPEYLCFIYAPRTIEEVGIVMDIVRAGAQFVADMSGGHGNGHAECPNHFPKF